MTSLRNIIVPFLGLLCSLQFNDVLANPTTSPTEPFKANRFASDLFSIITDAKSTKNIIYSPFSIQSVLAMAYVGAGGETSEIMRKGLKLGEGNKDNVIDEYGKFLDKSLRSDQKDAPELKTANRIYVNEYYRLKPTFNEKADKIFHAQAVSFDFRKRSAAAEINQWIEDQTQNRIENLVKSDDLDDGTTSLMVNAIYFKGNWKYPFSEDQTRDLDFQINSKQRKSVRMMYNTAHFNYVNLPELKASALELPYKNSNISMLIILPNEVEGLQELETSLRSIDLDDISKQMSLTEVSASLPKFRLEYEIDLKEPLIKLGLENIFSKAANFQELFDTPEHQRISRIKHKAFLDVNEAGSEAAAATFQTSATLSASLSPIVRFNADHPFVFAIRSEGVTYFAGHVADF